MFKVKCKVADWCEGNDRGYYRKPKEFIYTNKFETEKEAQEFMEKEKAKHIPSQRRTSIYSDYEVIKDLDENFDVYKKDQKYNIIYADKDGKDNEFKFTPEEDMSKPEMIMKCKEANKNFVKLKEIKKLEEGVHRMKKRYKDFKKIKKEANNKFLNLAQYFWDECSEYFENAYYENDSYEEFNEELSNDGTLMEEFAEQDIVSDKDIDKLIKEIYEMAQELLEKNKEMIQEALEENNQIKTLADIIEDRYKKGLDGLDVGDNTIDMIVYFDYNPEDVTNSADTYSKCLDTIATGTKVVNYDEEGAYAVVDFYNYVIDHLNAFTSNFTINIDPADGEDNETIAANIVEGILPGLFSGYTDDHTYNSLDTDLLMGVQKKEEKKEQYTLDNIDDAIHEIRSKIAKQRAYDRRRDAVCLSIGDDETVYKPMYDELKRLNAIKKDLQSNKEIKEESFEDSKKFMAGEILAIIDRYIHTSDLENLFKDMDIDQSIYEGDKDIPDGKIQDIVEIGLQWLFDHLQPEDYKRVLKNDLEMTDEEMEKYGVELEESKKIEEGSNYGGLINSGEDQIFGSITNTEVYERLQGIRDYLQDYYEEVKKNSINYQAEQHPEELKVAASKVREAIEALDRAWEE